MTGPSPPAEIPDFLLESLENLSPDTLRTVAEYGRGETTIVSDVVPDSVVEAFALQDDETVAATAAYADAVAEFLEDRDAESLAAASGNRRGEEEKWGGNRITDWHVG